MIAANGASKHWQRSRLVQDVGGLKAGARLVYRDTRICSLALECTQTERGSLRQPRQARNVSDNASPHAPRQKGSVAIDEYEQRLPGPPGAAGKAPSHGQESPAEDKTIEEDRAYAVFASVDGKGHRAGANGGAADAQNSASSCASACASACAGASASTGADAHRKEAASGLRRPGPGHAGLDAAELAGPRAGALGAGNTDALVVARQHRGPAGRG